MEAKYEEITLGEPTCKKLKEMYFNERDWSDSYRDVAARFSELKAIMRKFYPDKTIIEILQELIKYSSTDIQDIFDTQKFHVEPLSQGSNNARIGNKYFYPEIQKISYEVPGQPQRTARDQKEG